MGYGDIRRRRARRASPPVLLRKNVVSRDLAVIIRRADYAVIFRAVECSAADVYV
jgi:hypothetical protein